ncbi:hypothetical protein GOC60_14600 [Sinorhizobium meliloti]|nr:hypothetical protein [Sinorhizobium meliloti]
MTAMHKTRCEMFHAFDGKCCAEGEPCPFVPRPPTAIQVAAAHSIAQRGMIAGLAALTILAALSFAVVATERSLEQQARTNQERIAVR